MADRAMVFEAIQIGVEVTKGTGVAANKRLTAANIEFNPEIPTTAYAPGGSKYNTLVVPNTEHVVGSLSGIPTYTELVYFLSSVIDEATITTPTDAVLTRRWEFVPGVTGPDATKSFTVERGSSVRAEKFTYCQVNRLRLVFSRTEASMDGEVLGQNLQDDVALTGSPTTIDLKPILPKTVDVYLDDAAGDIGTTKLEKVWSTEWMLEGRYSPFWPLNSANASYGGLVEVMPNAGAIISLAADDDGMGFLTQLRAGSTKYMKIVAQGDLIESEGAGPTDFYHQLEIEMAVKVSEPQAFTDVSGYKSIGWGLSLVDDSDLGYPFMVALQNELTAL